MNIQYNSLRSSQHPARRNRSPIAVVATLALVVATVAACGRSEIEDGQREWLDSQHALETRLVSSWRAHDSLRRAVPADHSRETIGDDSNLRFIHVDSVLIARRRALDGIAAMVDRHSLARENAIRADDAVSLAKGLALAKSDYAQSLVVLDSVARDFEGLAVVIRSISFKHPPGDTAAAIAAPNSVADSASANQLPK